MSPKRVARWVLLLLVGLFCWVPRVHALFHELPDSLVPLLLSETVPSAFSPNDFEASDFIVTWEGQNSAAGLSAELPLKDIRFRIGKESLEWVRVADVFVLPRARLIVQAVGIEGGQLRSGGFTQSFRAPVGKGKIWEAQLPIALISGPKNPITVTILRNGKELKGTLGVRFRPQERSASPRGESVRIYYDTTCSRFDVRTEGIKLPRDSWAYVGCRLVYSEGDQHRTGSLEVFVFWDGVGQSIQVDGVETPSTSVSVWPLRLRNQPGKVTLSSGSYQIQLRYFVPDRLRLGFIGMGIGPYQYTYNAGAQDINTVAPVLTLYGSYFITETMRLVMFDATSLHKKFFTDFGIYLLIEQVRTLDERFSLNFLLGAHGIGFRFLEDTFVRISAPQGVEVVFRDFLFRKYNASLGAFVYPPIQGRSYYNIWLRYGKSALFGEFNYISWREEVVGYSLFNRSVGVTVGFPLGTLF